MEDLCANWEQRCAPRSSAGLQADTASSAASAGPSLEAFPLTREEPAAGWGLPSSPLPSLSPSLPLLYRVDDGEGGGFGVWNG